MTFPVPPKYRQLIFKDLAITEQPERLWAYVDRDNDDTFCPKSYLHIYDYALNSDELEEYNLKPVPLQPSAGFKAYGMYEMTSEGAIYKGWGETTHFCVAHTLYQAIRQDFWKSNLGFNPTINFCEAMVFGETECIPTKYMRFENKEEMNDYIETHAERPTQQFVDDVWVIEYAPSQFKWATEFEDAVKALLPHLPENFEVH